MFVDTVAYNPLGSLALLTSPYSADFDGDRRVDAVDLAWWQNSARTSAAGDADGDGDTDGRDFLAWQRQTGSAAAMPAEASFAAVPEPCGGVLCGVAGVMVRRMGRIGCRRVRPGRAACGMP
jgi:hypothetical protein